MSNRPSAPGRQAQAHPVGQAVRPGGPLGRMSNRSAAFPGRYGRTPMIRRRLTLTVAALSTAFAATAPAAIADVRWAAPEGAAGAACTSAAPCRLDTAVNG